MMDYNDCSNDGTTVGGHGQIDRKMRNAMRRILLIVMLDFVSTGAFAGWDAMFSDYVGTLYVDPDTIQKSGNVVTMESLNDFRFPQETERRDKYYSSRALAEYDCKEYRYRYLKLAYFGDNMAGGAILYINARQGDWHLVPPDAGGIVPPDAGGRALPEPAELEPPQPSRVVPAEPGRVAALWKFACGKK
jgi:hypothetical protein